MLRRTLTLLSNRTSFFLETGVYKIIKTGFRDVEKLPGYKPGVNPKLYTIVPKEFSELAPILATEEFTPQEWATEWAFSAPPSQSVTIRREGNVNSVWCTLGSACGLQLLPEQSCAIPLPAEIKEEKEEAAVATSGGDADTKGESVAASATSPKKPSLRSRVQSLGEGMVLVDGKVCLVHVSLLSFHDLPPALHYAAQKGIDPAWARYNAITGEFLPLRLQRQFKRITDPLPAIPKVTFKDAPNSSYAGTSPLLAPGLSVPMGGSQQAPYQALFVARKQIDVLGLKLINNWKFYPEDLKSEDRYEGGKKYPPFQCYVVDKRHADESYYHLGVIEDGYKLLTNCKTKTHLHPMMSNILIEAPLTDVSPVDGMAVEIRQGADGIERHSLIIPDLMPRLDELAKEKGYKSHHWEIMSENEADSAQQHFDADTAEAAAQAVASVPTHKLSCIWGSRIETVVVRNDVHRLRKRRKRKVGEGGEGATAADGSLIEAEADEPVEDPKVSQKRVDLVVRAAGDRAHFCSWPHLLNKVYTVEHPYPGNQALIKACDALSADLLLQESQSKIPFKMLGCDLEWACEHWSRNGKESRVALLQICSGNVVVMIRTSNHRPLYKAKNNLEASLHFPEPVRKILMDPTVIKCGVGILGDREKLWRDCGVLMAPVLETDVAADVFLPDNMKPKGASLKKITMSILNIDLAKSKRVTLSNWAERGKNLTQNQIEYASDDARASYGTTKKILEDGFQYIKDSGGRGVYDDGLPEGAEGKEGSSQAEEDGWTAPSSSEISASDAAMVKLVDDLAATEVFKRKFADLARVFEVDSQSFEFGAKSSKSQGRAREPTMLKLMGSIGASITNSIASSSPFFDVSSVHNTAAAVAADEQQRSSAKRTKNLINFSYVPTFGVLSGTVTVSPPGSSILGASGTQGIIRTTPITLQTVVGPEQILRAVLKLSFRLHHALNRRISLNEKLMALYREKQLAEDEMTAAANEANFLDDDEELPSFMVSGGGRKNFSLRERLAKREEREVKYQEQISQLKEEARSQGTEESPTKADLLAMVATFTPMTLNYRRYKTPVDFLEALVPALFPEAQQVEFNTLGDSTQRSSPGYLQVHLPSENRWQKEIIRLNGEGKEDRMTVSAKVLRASFPEWVYIWEEERDKWQASLGPEGQQPRRFMGPVVSGSFEKLEGKAKSAKVEKQRDLDMLASIVTEPLDQYPLNLEF